MSFIWPVMLFSLILVPMLVLLYAQLQRRRRRLVSGGGGGVFLQAAANQNPGLRRHVPPVLFLAGLSILLVALARPQAVVSLPRETGTVILAFDVSGSMAADDIKPTRMEAAKAAARDFVQKEPPTVQIGVVAFSDNGYSMQAPTDDQSAVLAAIARLAPQHGTSLANGIQASLSAIALGRGDTSLTYSSRQPTPMPTPTPVPAGTYNSAAIVLLSDGENNESPDPLGAAQEAANRGVRIYTVGLGSPGGTDLHINGFIVHTQLNEALLEQIAQTTNGAYTNAQNADQLRSIYENLTPQLVIKPEQMEVTGLFAGAAMLVMLLGGVFSMIWFGRLP